MKKSLASWLWTLLLLPVALAAATAPGHQAAPLLAPFLAASAAAAPAAAPDPERSAAAFRRVAEVLRHPRCLNCHTKTDFPRQTDERRPHAMGVVRGADNAGVVGMRCSTCHADENVDEVPGAPHWSLAPLSMAWEELDDAQLAEAIKDPVRNGKRSLEELYTHMAKDPLVVWAWAPGSGRLPPPISHAEFARLVREWIDTGAVTPAAGKPAAQPGKP